jgi:hypothetical protein
MNCILDRCRDPLVAFDADRKLGAPRIPHFTNLSGP